MNEALEWCRFSKMSGHGLVFPIVQNFQTLQASCRVIILKGKRLRVLPVFKIKQIWSSDVLDKKLVFELLSNLPNLKKMI